MTGMIIAFAGGPLFPAGVTGVTVETETGTLLFGATSVMPTFPSAGYSTMTVAVLVPSFSATGSYVTVSVIPAGPSVPVDGETVAHGLSVRALKVTGGFFPAMKTFCVTASAPASIEVCPRGVSGRTNTAATGEYGPRSSRQLLMARTR